MSINTAQFTDIYFPNHNSTTTTIKNYAYWLNKDHGKSIVVAPKVAEYVDKEPYPIIRNLRITKQFKDTLRLHNLDLVHVHSPFSAGKLAVKIAKDNHIPIVGTFYPQQYLHYKEDFKIDFLGRHYLKKMIHFYNQVDYLFTYSSKLKSVLKSNGYKGKIDIIESGTDYLYNENVVLKDKEYINHLYDINPDTNVFLYVGELEWYRNLKLILESLVNLRKLRQNFRMIFVGEGNARDDMIKFVEENKLKKYVIFVNEINDREQLKRYYTRANVLLYPSIHDGTYTVVREAASLRCSSLVVKDTPLTELIKDNYNGYLSENNSLSYAQRIISAINDRNNDKVGMTAEQTLTIKYEKIVKDLALRYSEIIKSRKQY